MVSDVTVCDPVGVEQVNVAEASCFGKRPGRLPYTVQPLRGWGFLVIATTVYGLSAFTRGYSYQKTYGLIEDDQRYQLWRK